MTKVDVYFESHPKGSAVTLKCDPTLLRSSKSPPTPRLVECQERFARTRGTLRRVKPASKPQVITHAESVRAFLRRWPRGFRDRDYVSRERVYKLEAHDLFRRWLSPGRRVELLQRGRVPALVDLVLHIEGKTNLLSPFEKIRLRDGLRDQDAALRFFGALSALIDAPAGSEGPFRHYVSTLLALPASRGRVATWPVATILPFLAHPTRYFLVKPRATKAAAQRLGIDLAYDPTPNWKTYREALRLADELKARLAFIGCRDMIDVQSFIWYSD